VVLVLDIGRGIKCYNISTATYPRPVEVTNHKGVDVTNTTTDFNQLPLLGTIEIKATKGTIALIDAIDSDLTGYKWFNTHGYIRCKKLGLMHRVILQRMIGRELSKFEEIDHANGIQSDNRRCNLRIATSSENHCNRGKPKSNTTGFKGVSRYPRNKKNPYRSTITINYRHIDLGYFATPELAYAAYCEAAEKYHGEFRRIE